MQAVWVSGESPFPGSQRLLSHCVCTWQGEQTLASSSSHKGTNLTSGPTPMISSLPRGPEFKLQHTGGRISVYDLGGHNLVQSTSQEPG